MTYLKSSVEVHLSERQLKQRLLNVDRFFPLVNVSSIQLKILDINKVVLIVLQ